MAPTYKDIQPIIDESKYKVFTFNEAIDYMKMLDEFPTTHTINWINVKTKKPITIAYSHSKK